MWENAAPHSCTTHDDVDAENADHVSWPSSLPQHSPAGISSKPQQRCCQLGAAFVAMYTVWGICTYINMKWDIVYIYIYIYDKAEPQIVRKFGVDEERWRCQELLW